MDYLIDVGSSTVKVYQRSAGVSELVEAQTFDFKHDFEPNVGLSEENYDRLTSYFSRLLDQFSLTRTNTKIYATGIFREIANPALFVERFYVSTRLYFNIVSHELEEFYLETAWTGKVDSSASYIVLNVGGRTTELVFYESGTIVDRELLQVGVGPILKHFPRINEDHSLHSLEEIEESVRATLPSPAARRPVMAICTGGELTYMKLAGYPLTVNSFFSDDLHPSEISISAYESRNQDIFGEVSIESLRDLMPENPSWMNGARAYSAIAQAICKHYGVQTLVPSDSNLIDGVGLQELRTVTLCGSFNKHLTQITEVASSLRGAGIDVLSPSSTSVVGSKDGFVLFEGDNLVNNCSWSVEAMHLKAIEECDAVLVCNFDDYVGSKTSMEIGYAYRSGKRVVFLKDGESVADFDLPSEVGMLNIQNSATECS